MRKCDVARSQASHCRRGDMQIWNGERQVKATTFSNVSFPFNKQNILFKKKLLLTIYVHKKLYYCVIYHQAHSLAPPHKNKINVFQIPRKHH